MQVGRVLTAQTLVTQMMEIDEKWGAITNYFTYTMQKKGEDERQ